MHRASDDLSDPDRNLAESSGQADIPEDSMDLITEEINDARIHTPPPRIAARFYRPTNNRRKSSAASSRRNSISSAHSHQSHASSRHGGVQSNYIAQHLRRASIIEDRRARLADRAAHAEKVRLRAALAKAAPRSTTNSEERALAAQHAREKNLAEIVASCAEEVKRAKGIAESMKEKREAENKKLRREMEERLAEADRRREELLNKGSTRRGRSLSQMRKSSSPMPEIKETISEATAAGRIQHRWRIHRRWKALKDFADLSLTIDGVRETSFEDVVELLAQEKVLVSTAHILRICGLKEGESGSVNEMTAVRTFLSAFLILGHPTQVLSSKGEAGEQEQVGVLPMKRDDLANPQLQDLVSKARDLLISFENVLSRLNAANNYTPPPAQLSSLSEVYATFYNAFIAWKARDSSTLIDMMVLQFVELDSIWQTVKDSTEAAVTESYIEGIRENQIKLMVRIKKLAGPAQGKRLITNAIRESRKTRTANKPAGDSRPRAAESNMPTLPDLAASEKSVKSQLQTLTPPSTPPRNVGTRADGLRTVGTDGSVLPENRILVHELAVNREYRIEMDDSPEHRKRDEMMQKIFAGMRQAVASGRSDDWVLSMATNVRVKLQHLLTEGNSMHTLIGEALDEEVVARELRSGHFSYEKFFSFMGTILPQLCAPFRDDEVKVLVEMLRSGDVVDRLQALLHFIYLMQLDYANYLLQKGAPDLLKYGIAFETKRFSEIMEETSNDLTKTEAAWRESRLKVMTEAARRDPENVGLARARPGPDKIYAQMMVDVFTSLSSSPLNIPETLDLDIKRLMRIRADVLRIVTSGAVLLQCKNLLKRDVRSQWKVEATRVYSVLENAKNADQMVQGIQSALESSRSMPVATKNHIKELVSRNVAASMSAATSEEPELRDPVMRLLLTRLRGHLLARLTATTEKEKVKSASTASESLATLGLPEFVQKVGGIVDEVGKVGLLDRDAHGPWYEMVAGKVEEEVMANAENIYGVPR
ncbi:T-complex 11 1 [Hyphodiscus hymeniophilus]|uniref:T-complex 11 1 n=1 Tax=Hyphodiscus hymeniophilus TaxID=353542 RepID=A0A9P6SNC6_9HELO|nr:T-complex 11 1 [Hyphodiscus hymeniophilus]